MRHIASIKNYKIYGYKNSNSFIIHNTDKKYEDGHTHITGKIELCYYIIRLSIKKKLPRYNTYIIESMKRLSNDEDFISLLQQMRS